MWGARGRWTPHEARERRPERDPHARRIGAADTKNTSHGRNEGARVPGDGYTARDRQGGFRVFIFQSSDVALSCRRPMSISL